jgi:hypothetical protein
VLCVLCVTLAWVAVVAPQVLAYGAFAFALVVLLLAS